ncbi:MAG: alpha/beta hydrolase [Bacteroidota bacterium]
MASIRTLQTSRTAHYIQRGTLSTAGTLWIVLHGYGQRAADFIQPFEAIRRDTTCIVAPEALSRFYTDGTHGDIGASWMTSAHRTHEIRDYTAYLNRLHAALIREGAPDTTHVLGFSQGAATACRWVARTPASVDRLTLWAGRVPPDLDLEVHAPTFRTLDLTLVRGTDDPYISANAWMQMRDRLGTHDIDFDTQTFEGGHRLHTDTLHTLAASE